MAAMRALVEATRAAFVALAPRSRPSSTTSAPASPPREAAADYARHAHEELTALDAQPGEEEALAERRQRMMQGEKVAADIREAHENLSGDSAILPVLSAISRRLQRRMPQAPELIEPSVKALDEAMQALETATQAVESALAACDFDPRELEKCEERLFALRGMARKHATHGRQSAGARATNTPTNSPPSRRARCASSRSRPRRAPPPPPTPPPPRRCRTRAPPPRARWRRRSTPSCRRSSSSGRASPWRSSATIRMVSPDGYDRAEFTVQTNPGSRPGPLMKVASGGELARFLLALKVSLAERDTAPTLVFDEVDSGVGGAVADAIGQRLARLAAKAQVLAVTHAPQVAARSNQHFRIVKNDVGKGERVATQVLALDASARREEIARMLAGAEITGAARAAAKSLIEKAG